MLLLQELFGRRAILLIPKDNLRRLPLDVNHLTFAGDAPVLILLLRAELRLMADRLTIGFVETLGLLLTVHSRIVPWFDALRSHLLILA